MSALSLTKLARKDEKMLKDDAVLCPKYVHETEMLIEKEVLPRLLVLMLGFRGNVQGMMRSMFWYLWSRKAITRCCDHPRR